MNYREIVNMLAEMCGRYNTPFVYYSFPENQAPPLPYIVYYYPGTQNFAADNKVYKVNQTLNIELYTQNKDFRLEEAIEDVLEKYGIVWDKTETYINSEHMFEVLYELEVIINGR